MRQSVCTLGSQVSATYQGGIDQHGDKGSFFWVSSMNSGMASGELAVAPTDNQTTNPPPVAACRPS